MTRILFYIKLLYNFLKKYRLIFIFGIIFGIFSYLSIENISKFIKESKTEIIGITGRCHLDDMPLEIRGLISNGLTKYDNNLIPIPNLALSWETTDKGKTWIFYLKNDISWQDDEQVTSENINFNFSDVKTEILDNKSIKFTLENNLSSFPSILSKPLFKKGLIGNGNWVVKKILFSGSYVKQLNITDGSRNIIYKFYPTFENTKTAFKLGKINQIIDLYDTKPFNDWKNINIDFIL